MGKNRKYRPRVGQPMDGFRPPDGWYWLVSTDKIIKKLKGQKGFRELMKKAGPNSPYWVVGKNCNCGWEY